MAKFEERRGLGDRIRVVDIDHGPALRSRRQRAGQEVSVGPFPAEFLMIACKALDHRCIPNTKRLTPMELTLPRMVARMEGMQARGLHSKWEIMDGEDRTIFTHRTESWRLQIKITEQAWNPRQEISLVFSTKRGSGSYEFLRVIWIGSGQNPRGNWHIDFVDPRVMIDENRWDRVELLFLLARSLVEAGHKAMSGDLMAHAKRTADTRIEEFLRAMDKEFGRWERDGYPERCRHLIRMSRPKPPRRRRPRRRTGQVQVRA